MHYAYADVCIICIYLTLVSLHVCCDGCSTASSATCVEFVTLSVNPVS